MEQCVTQKQEKVSDRAMLSRVIISASIIVSCLIALSFSAYAWFSCDVSSGTNTISAAAFDVAVVIADQTPTEGVYSLKNGEYTVQLTATGNATNGFCVVKVTAEGVQTVYHTRQIYKAAGLTLKLDLSGLTGPATVEFLPSLGTSAHFGTTGNPMYLDSNQLEITGFANNVSEEQPEQTEKPDEQEQSSQPEQTVYTVVEGDTLLWIAEEYGTTVEAISEINGIADKRTIQIGQELIIPAAETE